MRCLMSRVQELSVIQAPSNVALFVTDNANVGVTMNEITENNVELSWTYTRPPTPAERYVYSRFIDVVCSES